VNGDAARPKGSEETDFLLLSIEDLEREYAAGDLDEATYQSLRSRYVADAAARLRAEGGQSAAPVGVDPATASAVGAGVKGGGSDRWRKVLPWVLAGVLAVVVGATFARFAGARAPGESLVGSGSLSSRLDACAQMGPANPKGGECYEAVLSDFPNSPEALTYSGWAKVRAGEVEAGTTQLDRAVELDAELPDPHVFLAVVASRDEDWDTARAELDTVYELDPPPALTAVLDQQGLELKIAEGSLSPELATCWKTMRSVLEDPEANGTQAKVVDLIGCLGDRVTALAPKAEAGDTAVVPELTLARSLLGFVLADSDDRLVTTGLEELNKALVLSPGDPTALMLRSFVYGSQQKWDLAAADAEAAAAAPTRPSGLVTWFLGRPAELVQAVESARGEGASGASGTSGPSGASGGSGSGTPSG
jgi:tetratricopeptide (TPR) repeat protein